MAEIRGGGIFEARLKNISAKAGNAKQVKVGFMADATYPDGKPVALIAAINEFGSDRAPPRPFFRRMIAAKEGEWPPAVARLLKSNDFDADLTLNQTGGLIAGQLTQSVNDLVDPILADSTVARKGFDKPLIDTSVMVKSIAFLVE